MVDKGTEGFHVAPFAPDGDLVDVALRMWDTLSPNWILASSTMLASLTASKRVSWGEGLSHIETGFVGQAGAALVTFYVRGVVVLSGVLLSGIAPQAENELLGMFVDARRRTDLVKAAALNGGRVAFEDAKRLRERPVAIFVIWHPDSASDEDMEVVRDLSLHLAAAYFRRELAVGEGLH